jgi:hypothetical protein
MLKFIQNINPFVFILVATVLEVTGDSIVRMSIYNNHAVIARIGLMLIGALLLFGYGFSLNLAPVEFSQIVGLYIATLFIVWQVINFIAFRTLPTTHIIVGGLLVIIGGLLITFWKS